MDYVLGIAIGILFIFLFGGLEGILLPLGKLILNLFHIKKYSSGELSRKDQNVNELVGFILYILILATLIYIKNKF
jgi:hypothetical protein